jgi:acetolactate synthase-1/2/3 large subunit
MAQGMARSTGKVGVCIASSGPGATNLVTAIADAKLDSVPLICITGQVPTALIGTDAFQEVATVQMTAPIAKGSFFVSTPSQLAGTFARELPPQRLAPWTVGPAEGCEEGGLY